MVPIVTASLAVSAAIIALLVAGRHTVVGGIVTEHLGVDRGHPSALDPPIGVRAIAAFFAGFVPLGVGFFRQGDPEVVTGVGGSWRRNRRRPASRCRLAAWR